MLPTFALFETPDGKRIAINPTQVVKVKYADTNLTKIISVDGEIVTVQRPFDVVMAVIKQALFGL